MWCKCEASLLSEYCFIWFFQNITFCTYPFLYFLHLYWGRRGCDRMVVGFTTTYAISAYHHWCEFEFRSGRDVQHYVIKVCQWLVTDQWFSAGPPVSSTNKTDRHDITEILLKVAFNTIKPNQSQPSFGHCLVSSNFSFKVCSGERFRLKHNPLMWSYHNVHSAACYSFWVWILLKQIIMNWGPVVVMIVW